MNIRPRVSDPQQSQQFRPRHEQLASQRSTGAKFPTLNKSIHTEVIHSQKVGRFLDRIRESFLFGSGWLGRRRNERVHANTDHTHEL